MRIAVVFFLLFVAFSVSANGVSSLDSIPTETVSYSPTFDFIPEHDYALVEDRLSCISGEIPLTFNSRVFSFINYFAIKDREYTLGVLARKDLYFPLFEKYLAKYQMPEELKYLSIVESGLEPRALSRVGAGGLWQFMPYTGRSYGLHQDFYIDERFDPDAATEAACKYMKMLYNMFGDWELALAAYNSGPGNVRKAIRRSGYKKGFWNVYNYLPRETRSYVPQFIAVAYVLNYAEEYNLEPETIKYTMETDTILVSNFINLKLLSKEINVCYEDLEKLNPAIKRFALPASIKKYPVKIPADKVDLVRSNRSAILAVASESGEAELSHLAKNTPGSTYGRSKVVHRVRSGDVLGTIARTYRVRVSDVKKWNNQRSSMIRVGQRLNIWLLPSSKYSSSTVATTKTKQKIQTRSTGQVYMVQPGDTLWDISRMYEGLSIEKLKKLNNLKSNNIKPGQKLIIG
jgi:membrane-bound lytic murein transglycosylase D